MISSLPRCGGNRGLFYPRAEPPFVSCGSATPAEVCSKTGVETNLLIMLLNVPVGGEMSYFRPRRERSRKKEGRGKQYLRTAGHSGAQRRRITPHRATERGAMCACAPSCPRAVVNKYKERHRGKRERERG